MKLIFKYTPKNHYDQDIQNLVEVVAYRNNSFVSLYKYINHEKNLFLQFVYSVICNIVMFLYETDEARPTFDSCWAS